MFSSHSVLPQVFDETEELTSGESRLMQAVIVNAIYDAIGRTGAGGTPQEKDIARRWFAQSSADFQEVCLIAGFDPEQVRSAALLFIDAHAAGPRRSRLPTLETIATKQRERLAA